MMYLQYAYPNMKLQRENLLQINLYIYKIVKINLTVHNKKLVVD